MSFEVVEVGYARFGPGVAVPSLDDLADVTGALAGTTGQTLVKGADGQWRPAAPPAAASYTHTQTTPAASWPITHNLSRYPQVTVVDTAGARLLTDVVYGSANSVTVTHAVPLAGVAYLL